jgi:hypothetical protein
MSFLYEYFDVKIQQKGSRGDGFDTRARFKRNRFTRTLYVFQSNCAPDGQNTWNEPGYGYGKWKAVN